MSATISITLRSMHLTQRDNNIIWVKKTVQHGTLGRERRWYLQPAGEEHQIPTRKLLHFWDNEQAALLWFTPVLGNVFIFSLERDRLLPVWNLGGVPGKSAHAVCAFTELHHPFSFEMCKSQPPGSKWLVGKYRNSRDWRGLWGSSAFSHSVLS